jgi:hypothetical protein
LAPKGAGVLRHLAKLGSIEAGRVRVLSFHERPVELTLKAVPFMDYGKGAKWIWNPLHRIEIKQIADHDLRAHAPQRLRAFVFISHHRTHRFPLLQQQIGDRAPYLADAAAAPVSRMGFAMFFPPMCSPKSNVRFVACECQPTESLVP